jgi:nucleotide-binding universal stress UspA family protein
MTRVLAALDNSVTAAPVISTALTVAGLLGAELEAVHVRTDGDRFASSVAANAGVELVELAGPVVETLVNAVSEEDVALAVLGTRATPGGARPAGSTALGVVTSVARPVLLVPPETPHPGRIRRILVPLEGTTSPYLVPRRIIELASEGSLDVVVLHVLDEASLPAFTDQPQHETEAWAREFLERYCPFGVERVRLEMRVGRREELVPQVGQEVDADLIALGWSRALAPDRAPVVHAVLERGHLPVLLMPVAPSVERRDSFARLRSSPV